MSSEYFRKRRIRLLEKDPNCHWCRRPLKLPEKKPTGGTLPDDYPTIDHLKSRFWGKRKRCRNEKKNTYSCMS